MLLRHWERRCSSYAWLKKWNGNRSLLSCDYTIMTLTISHLLKDRYSSLKLEAVVYGLANTTPLA